MQQQTGYAARQRVRDDAGAEEEQRRDLGDSRDARVLGALGAFGAQGFGVGGEGGARFVFGDAGGVAGSDEGSVGGFGVADSVAGPFRLGRQTSSHLSLHSDFLPYFYPDGTKSDQKQPSVTYRKCLKNQRMTSVLHD